MSGMYDPSLGVFTQSGHRGPHRYSRVFTVPYVHLNAENYYFEIGKDA